MNNRVLKTPLQMVLCDEYIAVKQQRFRKVQTTDWILFIENIKLLKKNSGLIKNWLNSEISILQYKQMFSDQLILIKMK